MYPISSNQSNIFSLLQSGNAFDTSIIGVVGATTTSLEGASSSMLSLCETSPGGLDYSAFKPLSDQLSTLTLANGPMEQLGSHIETQYSDLSKNLGMYVGQLNLQQGLNNVGSSLTSLGSSITGGNICDGINNFFGSIMGKGKLLLDDIGGAVGEIMNVINFGLDVTQEVIDTAIGQVQEFVSNIMSAATEITTMIATEVQAMANALADLLSYAATTAISALFNNPCGKLLLKGVGSAALLENLGV